LPQPLDEQRALHNVRPAASTASIARSSSIPILPLRGRCSARTELCGLNPATSRLWVIRIRATMRSDRYLGGHCWPARGVSSDEAPLITKSTRPPQCLNCGERGLRESAPRRKPKDTAVQSEFTRRTKVRNQGGQYHILRNWPSRSPSVSNLGRRMPNLHPNQWFRPEDLVRDIDIRKFMRPSKANETMIRRAW